MFYERLSHARKKDALIYDPCLLLIFLPEKSAFKTSLFGRTNPT